MEVVRRGGPVAPVVPGPAITTTRPASAGTRFWISSATARPAFSMSWSIGTPSAIAFASPTAISVAVIGGSVGSDISDYAGGVPSAGSSPSEKMLIEGGSRLRRAR